MTRRDEGRKPRQPGLLRSLLATVARGIRVAIREPLVHFLVLGGALFLIWPLIANRVAPPPNQIVISPGQMQRAIGIFRAIHMRPPTPEEVIDLAEQEVKTEVYYREGIALGLDRDDEIIRRRIMQKLQFMTQDIADQAVPTDKDLQGFLDQHREQFGAQAQIAFSQVYLNPTQHGASLPGDAVRLLARLNASDGRIDYASDSDVLPLPNDFEATALDQISSVFGSEFARAVSAQTPGHWVGPIPSGYGFHLVLVREHLPGTVPQLSLIRDAVLREWQSARRNEANREAYRNMRAKYVIKIEMPVEPRSPAVAQQEPPR